MKALAEKMAAEYANDIQVGYGHGIAHRAYLAGFEARDGVDARLREEHAEMLEMLTEMNREYHYFGIEDRIKSLIAKIKTP